jgi:hypothetical protein
LLSKFLSCCVSLELTTHAPSPGCLHPGARNPHREAIKHQFDPPLLPAPRSAATGGRRCVVGTHCAQRQRSFRVPLTHPARCEHRRRKRGQGLAFLVTFWAMPKSDWPRAATERAGGKHCSSFHQTLRQAQGEQWDAIFSVVPPPSLQPSPALRARELMARFVHTIGLVSTWVRWDRTLRLHGSTRSPPTGS